MPNKQRTKRQLRFIIAGAVAILVLQVVMFSLPSALSSRFFTVIRWDKAPCEILTSEVQADIINNQELYIEAISYRYIYNDKTYFSDNFCYESIYANERETKLKIVREYPAGLKTECYVNPDKPTEAVIYPRSLSSWGDSGIVGIAFAIIFLFGIIGLVIMIVKYRNLDKLSLRNDAIRSDILEHPPLGAWFWRGVENVIVGVRMSLWYKVISLFGAAVPTLLLIVLLFFPNVLIDSKSSAVESALAGAICVVSWMVFAFFAFGKVEVVIGKNSSVFIGLGSIGWRRKFNWQKVESISEGNASDNPLVKVISINGDKTIEFGVMLSRGLRLFLLRALKHLHQESKNGKSE